MELKARILDLFTHIHNDGTGHVHFIEQVVDVLCDYRHTLEKIKEVTGMPVAATVLATTDEKLRKLGAM